MIRCALPLLVVAIGLPVPAALVAQDEKKEPKPGEQREFDVGNEVKMSFCWVPGSKGKFMVGSPKVEQDFIVKNTYADGKRPSWMELENEHEVAGVDGFWMAKTEMTQAQYQKRTGINHSGFKNKVKGKNTEKFPVERVSWDDAQKCIKGMKAPDGIKRVALPSEVQWEWACRGGLGRGRAFYWGDALNGDKANCEGQSVRYPLSMPAGPNLQRPEEVGGYAAKAPHPWGLCDMHGNVAEWCEDYLSDYNNLPDVTNPVQTIKRTRELRVVRGGSWDVAARFCRSSYRGGREQNETGIEIGFRVCLIPD